MKANGESSIVWSKFFGRKVLDEIDLNIRIVPRRFFHLRKWWRRKQWEYRIERF